MMVVALVAMLVAMLFTVPQFVAMVTSMVPVTMATGVIMMLPVPLLVAMPMGLDRGPPSRRWDPGPLRWLDRCCYLTLGAFWTLSGAFSTDAVTVGLFNGLLYVGKCQDGVG